MEPRSPGGAPGAAPLAIGVGVSEDADARSAARKALGLACAMLPEEPALVVLVGTSGYDLPVLLGSSRIFTGPIPLIGGTSGPGLMTSGGATRGGGRGQAAAVMALGGAGMRVGVGHAEVSGNPRKAGAAAAAEAIAIASPNDGPPAVALMFAPPGHEESLLEGVVSVLGRGVPLLGCTVADEHLEARWAVFSGSHVLPNSVAVAVVYGGLRAGSAFSTGYWPTAQAAPAGGVSGRMVRLLGDRPAAQVYGEWVRASADELRGHGIRKYAALQPLAVEEPRTNRLLVKEPGTVSGDGSIGFLSDVREGDIMRLLSSTPESLISAAGAAMSESMVRADLGPGRVRGVLVAQGTGRTMALGERVGEVMSQLRHVAAGASMLGIGTLGEQSLLDDGRPVHQNLTTSVLVLGD